MSKMCGAKTLLLVGLALVCSAMAQSRRRLGGDEVLAGQNVEAATAVLVQSLDKLAAGDGPTYKLDKVISVRKQVVAGLKYKFEVSLIDAANVTKVCKVNIWTRAWIKKDGVKVTFDCPGEATVTKTHSA